MTKQELHNTEITLRLPLAAVNVITAALADRPYVQVADIIQAIREQAIPQVPLPAAQPKAQDTTAQ